ncbi:MAG: hypothetical protein CfP315_0775 [Candidatus Improbicoccus pseudotrichonymphae]|uniref:Uncharacterized protein n=1 Tax=Candidatus Improbicoccus pseudotrichonymphae TaxID=3033792 RepID=A0AA48HYQ3_9FIRM|nr:MAG: hypothetical protein CfP315_0775 [Candidatus Improbicoccus pseudotrichonymphae]
MKPKETCGSKLSPAETKSPLNNVAFEMLRIILFDSKIQKFYNYFISILANLYFKIRGGKVMKNKFIKSLMNSLNSREREREREREVSRGFIYEKRKQWDR